jgi:hypothetical protein
VKQNHPAGGPIASVTRRRAEIAALLIGRSIHHQLKVV